MPVANFTLTQEYLHQLFEYKNGNLYWKENRGNNKICGKKAGSVDKQGYLIIRINKKAYKTHRLMFLYHYGFIPNCIDHIDGNKINNNINNLREATRSQNGCNSKIKKNNTSGVKNVSWSKTNKKWVVQIRKNGKFLYRGFFDDLELAELVAIEARDKYHGKFANHG